MGFRSSLPQPNSSIYLIPLWLDILKRPSRVPGAACRSGTIATPPPKKSGGGRYRPHLSLREGLEQPPTSCFFQGVDAALDSSLFWRRLQRPGTRTGLGP